MWFRNLRLYHLPDAFALGPEALAPLLEAHAARPCGPFEPVALGWVPPLPGEGAPRVHAADGALLVCAERQERLLPGAVVRQAVAEQAAEIERAEGRPVHRKERRDLQDRVVQELLPKAFVRATRVAALVDPRLSLLAVDSASPKRAEEVVGLLRDGVGSLRARPLVTARAPASVMRRWLAGRPPKPFALGDQCVLAEPTEGGGVVRVRGLDLEAVQTHLEAGLVPQQVAVEWNERLGVVIGDDLALRRLRFLDLVREEAAAVEDGGDAAVRFDADFAIMVAELRTFLPKLLALFGGVGAEEAEA
jgi:recombination associated protein RdgC